MLVTTPKPLIVKTEGVVFSPIALLHTQEQYHFYHKLWHQISFLAEQFSLLLQEMMLLHQNALFVMLGLVALKEHTDMPTELPELACA